MHKWIKKKSQHTNLFILNYIKYVTECYLGTVLGPENKKII